MLHSGSLNVVTKMIQFVKSSLLLLPLLSITACTMWNSKDEPCTFVTQDCTFEYFSMPKPMLLQACKPISRESVTLRLENCTLPAFPNRAFSDLGSVNRFTLELCAKTSIQILAPEVPNYLPFGNFIFASIILKIEDAASLAGWNWNVLSGLKPSSSDGLQFNVLKTKLVYLHSDFGKIAGGQVSVVRIIQCRLQWLGDAVFAPFNSLKTLELRDNNIRVIARSHLPLEAPLLRTIDLGKNKLINISEDLFSNFDLTAIFLDGNDILIPTELTNVILKLGHFKLDSSLLWVCDCDIIFKLRGRFGDDFEKQSCLLENKDLLVEKFLSDCKMP